ncbi:MAG: SCP2 sterol-binding domain-containing protein [Actinobacteria bacterium]|nr:SCP2 sterol-binding domain-containing protein [Actinomycetota bacterium]
MMSTYALVRSLTDGQGSDVDLTVERLATAVSDAGDRGSMQLSLGADEEGSERSVWTLSLDEATAKRSTTGSVASDITLLTAPETFQRMAEGSYSPVQAFLDGKLRVRGDMDLAKRILRHLAGPDGRVDCR